MSSQIQKAIKPSITWETKRPMGFADMIPCHKRPRNYVSSVKLENIYLKWLLTYRLMHAMQLITRKFNFYP